MTDERTILERAIERFQPESGIVDRVYERRDRRQRTQRIAAATLALLLTAGVVAGLAAVSRSQSEPGHPPPPTLPMRMHNGSIDTFGFTNGVRMLDPRGVGAFVVKCADSCTEIFDASW